LSIVPTVTGIVLTVTTGVCSATLDSFFAQEQNVSDKMQIENMKGMFRIV